MPFCYQRQDKGLSLWPYESAKATRWDLQSSDPTTLHWFYLPAMHPQAIKHDEMTVFRVHLVLSHGLVLSSLRFQQDMFSPAWVAFEQTRWSFNYACSCSMGSGQGLHNDKVCPQHSEINSKLDYATNWVQLLCFSLKPRRNNFPPTRSSTSSLHTARRHWTVQPTNLQVLQVMAKG